MSKLWSHKIAQEARDPVSEESMDLKYALGARYGAGLVLVLPLPSGQFGIFDSSRQLVARVEESQISPEQIRVWSEENLARVKTNQVKFVTDLSPEDLGI